MLEKFITQLQMSPLASLHFYGMSHSTTFALGKKKNTHNICRQPASIVSDTVLDKGGHYPNKSEKQLLCQYCHKRSMWACVRCNVTLCSKHKCSTVFVVFLVLIFLALVVFSIMNPSNSPNLPAWVLEQVSCIK